MPKVEAFNKELVLEKASNVFHIKGFNATSMQDLVDETGLNRSSIYNSFGSKMNLFLDCLKNYQSKYQSKTKTSLSKINNPLKAIRAIFDLYLIEIVNDKDRKGCLITNCKSEMANQDESVNRFLNNNQEQTLQLLEGLVMDGQNEGLINKRQSAKSYGLYLFSSIQGLRMTGILVNNKQQLQSIIDSTMHILK